MTIETTNETIKFNKHISKAASELQIQQPHVWRIYECVASQRVHVLKTVLYTVRDTVPLCQSLLFDSFLPIFLSANFTQYLQCRQNTPVTLNIEFIVCKHEIRNLIFSFIEMLWCSTRVFVGSVNMILMGTNRFLVIWSNEQHIKSCF